MLSISNALLRSQFPHFRQDDASNNQAVLELRELIGEATIRDFYVKHPYKQTLSKAGKVINCGWLRFFRYPEYVK